jgi:tRNA(His) guanylyltransferase
MTLEIGDRMKSYENSDRHDGPVIVRVDGKNFHQWTKKVKAKKPFDMVIMDCMRSASSFVCRNLQGWRLAYTQSDEVSFLVMPGETGQLPHGGKPSKLETIIASEFTYHFNKTFEGQAWYFKMLAYPAYFDARSFVVPEEDVANYFYWRELDWRRNAVTMLAGAYYSHKELMHKSMEDRKDMLARCGVHFESYDPWIKHGTFFTKGEGLKHEFFNYAQINELAGIVTN